MFTPDARFEPKRRVPVPRPEESDQERIERLRRRNANYPVKILQNWSFYVGLILSVPLCLISSVVRRRGMAWIVAAVVLVLAAVTLQNTQPNLHYAAPVAALVYLIVVQGMRYLNHCRWVQPNFGSNLVLLIPAALAVCFVISQVQHVRKPLSQEFASYRAQLERRLTREGGKHLVVVRYSPSHNWLDEWVYNAADIDSSQIVWAHELTPEKNRQLLDYFSDRKAWLLEPDLRPFRITPHRQ